MTCTRCGGTGQEPNLKALGRQLRALRRESGLTMRQMAVHIGLSHSFVCQMERGLRAWRKGNAERLYRAAIQRAREELY